MWFVKEALSKGKTQLFVISDASDTSDSQAPCTRKVTLEDDPYRFYRQRYKLTLSYGPPDKLREITHITASVEQAKGDMDQYLTLEGQFARSEVNLLKINQPPWGATPSEKLAHLRHEEKLLAAQKQLDRIEAMVQFWLDARPQLQQYQGTT